MSSSVLRAGERGRRYRRTGFWLAFVALTTAVAVSLGGLASASSGKVETRSASTVTFGGLFLMSGPYASFGALENQGLLLATRDISAGGVLGQRVRSKTGDTEASAAQAAVATRQLMLSKPKAIAGPTSIEFDTVKPIIDSNHVPLFPIVGSAKYDKVKDKWVYFVATGDTAETAAMVYQAIRKGLKRCAIVYNNLATSQSQLPSLMRSFKAHGGTITSNVSLVPGQSSYSSEVLKAFNGNPRCIFSQMDAQTAGTFFANAKSLGHLNVPIIGSLAFSDPELIKAIGFKDANQWVTGVTQLQVAGPAFKHFQQIWTKAGQDGSASTFSASLYDGIVTAALAMTASKSTNATTWVNSIKKVANAPGVRVYTYAQGVKQLRRGKDINYEGASGPLDFNQYHHVFSGMGVVKFDDNGNSRNVLSISAANIAKYSK